VGSRRLENRVHENRQISGWMGGIFTQRDATGVILTDWRAGACLVKGNPTGKTGVRVEWHLLKLVIPAKAGIQRL